MLKNYTDVKSTIVKHQPDLHFMLEFIARHDVLGFDLETTGTNPRRDKIMGIGISNATEGFYLPLRAYNKETDTIVNLMNDNWLRAMLSALEGKKLVAWNGGFEAAFCKYTLSWDFAKWFYSDQMLMLHLLDENRYNYGLKESAEADFGAFTTISQNLMLESMKANGGTGYEYYKSDTDALGHYCVWDNCLTMAYYERDLPRLEREGQAKFFFEEEIMPFARKVLWRLETNGIRLDMPLLESSLAEIRADLARINSEILSEISPLLYEFNQWYANKEAPPKRTGPFAQAVVELLGPDLLPKTPAGQYSLAAKGVDALPDGLLKTWLKEETTLPQDIIQQAQTKILGPETKFNLLSKDHLKRLFFEKLGETPLSFTDKGAPQVDDRFLEQMARKYGWASKLQTYNRLTKLHGTYFERIFTSSEDGRFYPKYFAHRTKTGRQSGDFQQLPRPVTPEDEPNELIRHHNNKIRALFISDDGYKFLDADYASLEVVVFADDAGDEALLDMIRRDFDFYSTVAIGAFGLGDEYSADKKAPNFLKKHRPELRQKTKAFALGIRYGEEAFKLHHELNISKQEAETIIRNYFAAYPKLKLRMDEIVQELVTKGYTTTRLGRKRRQPGAVRIYKQYGLGILDSLQLWKDYNETPSEYAHMKKQRKELKSMINAALNFPIQGLAASIVTRASWKLADWLDQNCPAARIIGIIHDQCIVMCPESDLQFVKKNMKRIMESTTRLSVPLIADPAEAVNLRDGH